VLNVAKHVKMEQIEELLPALNIIIAYQF